MAHAEKCPICNGRGKVYDGENYGTTRYGSGFDICHGCAGKGWVEVADEQPLMIIPPTTEVPC